MNRITASKLDCFILSSLDLHANISPENRFIHQSNPVPTRLLGFAGLRQWIGNHKEIEFLCHSVHDNKTPIACESCCHFSCDLDAIISDLAFACEADPLASEFFL